MKLFSGHVILALNSVYATYFVMLGLALSVRKTSAVGIFVR